MTRTTPLVAAVVLAAVLTGCGDGTQTASSGPTARATSPTPAASCATHSGFELSLVSDRGGQRTPLRASEWFARHGNVADVPATGWRLDGGDTTGLFTRSGASRLHVVQGPDKTWQVDSGTTCGR